MKTSNYLSLFVTTGLCSLWTGAVYAQTTAPAAAPAPAPAAPAAAPAPAAPAAPAPAAPAPAPAPAAAPAPAPATVPLADAPPAAAPAPIAAEPAPVVAQPSSYESGGYEDATVGPEPAAAQKQSPFFVAVSWDINVPVGSTTDFVKKVDPAGLGIEGRYRGILPVGPGSFGAGFQVAWHSMEEKTDESIVKGRATITGTQVRELSTTPILAKLTYTFDKHKMLHPYIGYGLGAARVLRRLDLGIYSYVDESWHFAMAPEVGLEVPLSRVILLAAAKLNYFASTNDAPQQVYMNLCLGVGFN